MTGASTSLSLTLGVTLYMSLSLTFLNLIATDCTDFCNHFNLIICGIFSKLRVRASTSLSLTLGVTLCMLLSLTLNLIFGITN